MTMTMEVKEGKEENGLFPNAFSSLNNMAKF
jgi:hypothetical protein